jgi:hypothetical protein
MTSASSFASSDERGLPQFSTPEYDPAASHILAWVDPAQLSSPPASGHLRDGSIRRGNGFAPRACLDTDDQLVAAVPCSNTARFAFVDVDPVLANVAMMFGLCEIIRRLLSAGGRPAASLRSACARPSFSSGGSVGPVFLISDVGITSAAMCWKADASCWKERRGSRQLAGRYRLSISIPAETREFAARSKLPEWCRAQPCKSGCMARRDRIAAPVAFVRHGLRVLSLLSETV